MEFIGTLTKVVNTPLTDTDKISITLKNIDATTGFALSQDEKKSSSITVNFENTDIKRLYVNKEYHFNLDEKVTDSIDKNSIIVKDMVLANAEVIDSFGNVNYQFINKNKELVCSAILSEKVTKFQTGDTFCFSLIL